MTLLGAELVVLDGAGIELIRKRMKEIWPGSDRYQNDVSLPIMGDFAFVIEAYDDPYATWQQNSEIKISANTEKASDIDNLPSGNAKKSQRFDRCIWQFTFAA